MISSNSAAVVVDMRALAGNFNSEYDIIDSHNIDEDFFIEDLSEFSNEEIAAPIHKNLMDQYPPSTFHQQQHSDDHSASDHSKEYPPSTIKSDCTTTAHTSPSASVLLQHTNAASDQTYSSSFHIDMKGSPLSLPCQDETGFDWLTAFGEDNLIYGTSNLGMVDDSSFLLSSVEPFGNYDQGLIMKQSAYEDAIKVKDMQVGHNVSGASTDDERGGEDNDLRWSNEDVMKGYNVMTFTPHATGSRSARSKRARSAGWSSSNILCNNWENNSPTNSLNSTSQIIIPQYSTSPTFNIVCKEEEKKEQNDYSTTTNHMELISAGFDNAPKTDKPLTKFCSNGQAFRGSWAKEEDNTREESVSNYGGGLQPRRCTHCFSQKTPQWRAGPEGPKTLCNACGVRYKSGRLFDEYRPAKSPTFLSYKHSNSHKKVMEMRRRKAFHYNYHHHQHQQQHAAAQDVRALAPPPLKRGDVDSHLVCNKLKIKLNPAALDPHKHFSDVTLISTRNAVESPSSFLY